jgi:hypothetical protein
MIGSGKNLNDCLKLSQACLQILRNLNDERNVLFLYWKKGMEKQLPCQFPAKQLPAGCSNLAQKCGVI